MSITTLIMGPSGTGKSSSIRTLNPKETFIISVLNKPLPFKGGAKSYPLSANGATEGNFLGTDNPGIISKVIDSINANRPDIKTLILDDAHYIMANEYFKRANEKGFDKYSQIGHNTWNILNALKNMRQDILVFVIWHPELEDDGHYKCKTIGKSIDSKYGIEGATLHILFSRIIDGKYVFLTNHDGTYPGKTPIGMFDPETEKYVPNDLEAIRQRIINYYFGNVEL